MKQLISFEFRVQVNEIERLDTSARENVKSSGEMKELSI